jgi:hypothetical protein
MFGLVLRYDPRPAICFRVHNTLFAAARALSSSTSPCFLRTGTCGATVRRTLFGLFAFVLLVIPIGAGQSSDSHKVPLIQVHDCSGRQNASLQNYDRLSEIFLDEALRHPPHNLAGNVVWGTRYYLESLLTAYEATCNPKYIQAFLDSGQSVMNLVETMTVLNVPDPGEPDVTDNGSLITLTGWPTWLASFSVPAMVPTQVGAAALYAQDLGPANYFEVTRQIDGSLQLAWTAGGETLETHAVKSIADLDAIAAEPLIWGQSVGRIKPTGAGLPAPGVYGVYLPEKTIWNSEQAGGILLPFAHFLLLAKEDPGLVDEVKREEWTHKILTIASGYENYFISDGLGGLRLHNPLWLPNVTANTDAAMDYISVEATLRVFLFELTGDPNQLAIARGLVLHQRNFNWSFSPQGWLLFQLWPDFVPWSSQADAPLGNVMDSFDFDPSTPSPVTDAGFFVDFLHFVKVFKLERDIGIPESIYIANRAAFQQYILYGSGFPPSGSDSLLRGFYPIETSMVSDSIVPSQDPFAGAGFLTREVADQSFINANWNWMLSFGQDPHGGSIGYFLRAWARSEASELNVRD